MITLSDQSTSFTTACAFTYLTARILYVPAYFFGLVPWRSMIWSVGFHLHHVHAGGRADMTDNPIKTYERTPLSRKPSNCVRNPRTLRTFRTIQFP